MFTIVESSYQVLIIKSQKNRIFSHNLNVNQMEVSNKKKENNEWHNDFKNFTFLHIEKKWKVGT